MIKYVIENLMALWPRPLPIEISNDVSNALIDPELYRPTLVRVAVDVVRWCWAHNLTTPTQDQVAQSLKDSELSSIDLHIFDGCVLRRELILKIRQIDPYYCSIPIGQIWKSPPNKWSQIIERWKVLSPEERRQEKLKCALNALVV